jgi:S-DNA-T family DNA segregation ATPase FtsK/SpoIIIE
VTVELAPAASNSDLIRALSASVGVSPDMPAWIERDARPLTSAGRVADLRLRNGDRIIFAPERPPSSSGSRGLPSPGPSRWVLHAVGGPAAGLRFDLPVGEHVIGRDPDGDAPIPITDTSISRRHLALFVGDATVEIDDLGSTNGTRVDGRPITGRTQLQVGAVVEIGATLLSLEEATPEVTASYGYDAGQLVFNRPPRVSKAYQAPAFSLPAAPAAPDRARLPIAASIIPVVAGLVMFALLQNAMFLLFMLLGPAMAMFSWLDGQRSGTVGHRRAVAEYRAALTDLEPRIAQAHQDTLIARRREWPDPATVLAWVDTLSAHVWERRASDQDFLGLRVGLADQPTSMTITRPPDGDAALREEADDIIDRHRTDPDTPVVVPLRDCPVVGICGSSATSLALARWFALQIAVLHSPAEVSIVGMVDGGTEWDWLGLLPHAGTLAEGNRTVATSPDARQSLLTLLEERFAARRGDAARHPGRPVDAGPHVVVLIDGANTLDGGSLARLVAAGTGSGLSIIVRAERREELPGACELIVDAGTGHGTGAMTDTRDGAVTKHVVIDQVGRDAVTDAALALAPLKDAIVAGAAEVPASVRLLDHLPGGGDDVAAVEAAWAGAPHLTAVIGAGAGGPVQVDLRRDGPHALVAGTTGAGKSELLQSWVLAMAMNVAPERLTFLLIDYKGGAAFKDCVHLPHAVGFVTDLDAHLAERALASLEAELVRRESLLRDAGAKDLEEMERRHLADAPPSLVIVIDEFAFLKKEVPGFVDGVVDIAQRGRSLGVHLILATQRPAGVVDDQVRANTNLRVALRVADEHDSNDIIGKPDAARLPRSIPGRAFLRKGHGEVAPFQAGYVGGVVADTRSDTVSVRDFTLWSAHGASASGAPGPQIGSTDLQLAVTTVREAFDRGSHEPPPPPWLPPLEGPYPLDELSQSLDPAGSPDTRGIVAVLGVIDEPVRQSQRPYALDLADGNVLVFGASGCGKSTLLRSMATSLATSRTPEELWIYGLDFGSGGLRPIDQLPHCGAVIPGQDTERVERLLSVLDATVRSRQELLATSGVTSIADLLGPTGRSVPSIVVLLEGYAGFVSAFEQVEHGALLDKLNQLAVDGPAVGVVFVITANRRAGVPSALAGAVTRRIVMRMAEDDEYLWLDVPHAKGRDLPAGRGFTHDGLEFQGAIVGDDPSGSAQAAAIATIAGELRAANPDLDAPPIRTLPDTVELIDLPRPEGAARITVGLSGATLLPATVERDDLPLFLVAGPDRSGRSTALTTVARGLIDADPSMPAYLVVPRRSPLTGVATWKRVATTSSEVTDMLTELTAALDDPSTTAPLLVVDDGDDFADGIVSTMLEQCVRASRDGRIILLASAQPQSLHRAYGGWLSAMKKSPAGLLLHPDSEVDGDILGTRLPRRPLIAPPPGRGYLVQRGQPTLVQVAH